MTNTHKKSKLAIFFSYFRPHRKLFAIDMHRILPEIYSHLVSDTTIEKIIDIKPLKK